MDHLETPTSNSQLTPTADVSYENVEDDPYDLSSKKKKTKVVVVNPTLDIESYCSNYKDCFTKIDRLLFIAERCQSLQIDAYSLVLKELEQTSNVERYIQVANRLDDILASQQKPLFQRNEQWIASTRKASKAKYEQLESDMKTFRLNLIKENIRVGLNQLGDYYFSSGDLANALKSYSKVKDNCMTQKHFLEMYFDIIKVSLALGNYIHVQSFIVKVESLSDVPDKELVATKRNSVTGIINLLTSAYRKAARNFLDIKFVNSHAVFQTLSANDIATYGGLCALCSFDRAELKTKVLENSDFKQFLELEPNIREVIHSFYNLKFSACFERIASIRNDLLLDMYLHEHIDVIVQQIRTKAILQYFSPYLSVDMNKMASTFNCSISELEVEVSNLIKENHLQARIDSHNKILRAKLTDQRSKVFQKAFEVASEYQFNAKLMYLHSKLVENGIVVGS